MNDTATVIAALKECINVIVKTVAWMEETFTAIDEKAEEKQLSLEEVRAVLAEKSRAGFTAEVKALLAKYGANRLSEVAPEHYPALLKDAEVLNAT